jgi:hypothetical protein
MANITDIMRWARERDRRLSKARVSIAALMFDEKATLAVELQRELRAGPPKIRRRRAPTLKAPLRDRKTVRTYVTEALAKHAPLNAAGIHAAIDRVAPGVTSKGSVAAEVSLMVGKGLLVKAGIAGRGHSYALANGG